MVSSNNLALLLVFTLLYKVAVVDSFKFLAVLNSAHKSHFIVGETLMKALAARGHEVYVISAFPQTQPIKNYYDIPFQIEYDNTPNHIDSIMGRIFQALSISGTGNSEYVLKSHNVQNLMASNHTFDAVICEIFFSEPLFGLSEHFKAPLIGLSTVGASPFDTDMVGSPSPPSYVTGSLVQYTDHMSFVQRIVNFCAITVNTLHMELYYLPRQNNLYKKYFPNAARDMYTVRKNAAAVLLNSHVSFDYPRPYMPNHIEVGGMHIDREGKPLPHDIQKFIQDAKDGVVYFSMGSILKGTYLPAPARRAFLSAFSNLKQRVIWKFEDSALASKPDNVLICEWCPQTDILAHENVKVFLTHGGLLSITESIYHGTPIIGIPMFSDQFRNVAIATAYGIGIPLDFNTITAEEITFAIHVLITNGTYTQRVKEVSARYRDQPSSPRDLAVFWVEYIARHKGAKYLHCAGLDLNIIQYHNIDVLLVLCGGLYAFVYTTCYLLACLRKRVSKLFTSKTTREKRD